MHDQPGGTPITYVVPAGFVAVVRDMDAFIGSIIGNVGMVAKGSAAQVFWQETLVAPGNTWVQWRGRQVLFAGESFSMEADDVMDLTASGYLLTAP